MIDLVLFLPNITNKQTKRHIFKIWTDLIWNNKGFNSSINNKFIVDLVFKPYLQQPKQVSQMDICNSIKPKMCKFLPWKLLNWRICVYASIWMLFAYLHMQYNLHICKYKDICVYAPDFLLLFMCCVLMCVFNVLASLRYQVTLVAFLEFVDDSIDNDKRHYHDYWI